MSIKGGHPEVLPEDLLEKLWGDPTARSRNANFVRFRDDSTYRKAVLHVRSLMAFCRDLEKFHGRGDVSLRWLSSGRAAQITMNIPELHFRRSLFVSARELEILRRDPAWDQAGVVVDGDEPYLSR